VQTPSEELNRSLRLLASTSSAKGHAVGISDRAPRGPFQEPADGTSLRDAVRFWSKVRYGAGCWEWQATPSQAYGLFRHKGRMRKVNRVAYELTHGPIGALVVRHRCDNPRCVRPAHLTLGTLSDNVQDSIERERWANGNSKKKVCKRSHTPNWYVDKGGGRHCRPCAALHQRRRKARLRAEPQC
jgi:hypothetical protein